MKALPLAALAAAFLHTASAGLVEGTRDFTLRLHQHLGEGNTFFSPYSIASALTMTYGGARGNTAAEMARALRLPHEGDANHTAFAELRTTLLAAARETGQQLNIANGLCIVDLDIRPEFRELLQRHYAAEIFPGDLDRINAWVKEQTRDRIHPILEELPADTAAVLLNAIYFKGAWETEFDKNHTHDAPFHVSPDLRREVPLMHRTGEIRHLQTETLQAVSLPYRGGKFSMVVLLPREPGALAEIEAGLDGESLNALLTRLDRSRPREVQLYLPRFKLETEYDLVDPMRALGMNDAFDPLRADFSAMAGSPGDLFIGGIIHKAFVEVNEEGTEAAAATAVVMRMTSMPMDPPPVFRADHPFLFLIREHGTGAILFAGRLTDPGE